MSERTLRMEAPLINAGDAQKATLEWTHVYRIGAAAALLVVLTGLVDIAIMFVPGTGTSPGDRMVVDWFNLLQSQWFLALRDMGLLNMITMTCSVLVFFALWGAHRRINPILAALALVLVCLGAGIYIANNTALPMLTLSQHYAAADETHKALWAAAGQALLAREDLTAGAFPGFLFVEIAGLLMAWVALRGELFRRWEPWVGVISTLCLLFFNICAAFIPALYDSVMLIFGAGGGLLGMLWYALIARRLLQPPAEFAR